MVVILKTNAVIIHVYTKLIHVEPQILMKGF